MGAARDRPARHRDPRAGRGVSYAKDELVRTYVGIVADVTVDRTTGRVKVDRVFVVELRTDHQSRREAHVLAAYRRENVVIHVSDGEVQEIVTGGPRGAIALAGLS